MQTKKQNKMRLMLAGPSSAPKLYSALQLAYGLCGNWNKIVVVGSSPKDPIYQHLGSYSTLTIPRDATPQRYSELLNLCAACKEVVVFSTLSQEWTEGVLSHATSSYYPEVLRAHRELFSCIRQSPVHILCCLDNKSKLSCNSIPGKPWVHFDQQLIQQEGIEQYFTSVVTLDKKGRAKAEKDLTHMLPVSTPFTLTPQVGALLQDWCVEGEPEVAKALQARINGCHSLSDLYQLLFDLEIEDVDLITAFTKRRLELDYEREEPYPLPVDRDEEAVFGGPV